MRRWVRQARKRKKWTKSTARGRKEGYTLEPLEARILLSADQPLDGLHPDCGQTVSGSGIEQLFHLDFDGASGVRYDGPLQIDGIEISPFQAPDFIAGQEQLVVDALLASLDLTFAGLDVHFTTEAPREDVAYSTIYIGHEISGFDATRGYVGLAEQVDPGNADPRDEAFVFGNVFEELVRDVAHFGSSALGYGTALAEVVAHEAAHLLGFEHAHEDPLDGDPLAAVAFKPNTHIEGAGDVRRDVLEDGHITIEGQDYPVHPRIVEALKKYPSFFYGGNVGPDGLPDLAYGQGVIHPDSIGIWLGHILDAAWAAQGEDSSYSPEEQLQILSWSYGYVMHTVGDLWAHTLVNEFGDGPFPDFASVVTEGSSAANAIRHFIVEAYIEDAAPGRDGIGEVDGEVQREQLANGDVSNEGSVTNELDAPHQFIFDTFLDDLPDLVGHSEDRLFTIENPGGEPDFVADRIAELRAGVASASLLQRFTDADVHFTGAPLVEDFAPLDPVDPVTSWRIKVDFRDFIVREAGDSLEVSELEKSRGIPVGIFLTLRDWLVTLRDALPAPEPNFEEPFSNEVGRILDAGDRLLMGDEAVDPDALLDDLTDLGQTLLDSFGGLFGDIAGNQSFDITTVSNFAETMATTLGTTTSTYLDYWIANIDEGLEHWSELGLSISRGLFDPQSKRDLQNQESDRGPEAVDPDFVDRRADAENEVGLLGVLIEEIEDPDNDLDTSDSFLNAYLLPMLGVPDAIGDLRAGFQSFLGELDDQILQPTRQLLGDLNPFDPFIDWIKEEIQEYLYDVVRTFILERFDVDIAVVELLTANPSALMDLEGIDLGFGAELIFKPTDRELLDAYLGFDVAEKQHLLPLGIPFPEVVDGDGQITLGDGSTIGLSFHEGAMGGLKDDVEFDKERFAAYANMVTMGKLLLLQETLVGEAPVGGLQPKTISHLLSDLTGAPYDFELLDIQGDHGGNILTTTLPGVVDDYDLSVSVFDRYTTPTDAELWYASADVDHGWRENSLSRRSSLYRAHATGDGTSQAEWAFTNLPDGAYDVQVDWLINNQLTDLGEESPAHEARYQVFIGDTLVATSLVDQSRFPDDVEVPGVPGSFEPGGSAWEQVASGVAVTGGTLRVVLSDDDATGSFVVAGRVRIVATGGDASTAVVADVTNTTPETLYSETSPALFTTAPLAGGEEAALDARTMPQSLLDAFEAEGVLFATAFELARASERLDIEVLSDPDFDYGSGLVDGSGLIVQVLDPGREWRVVRTVKADAGASEKIVEDAHFRLVFDDITSTFEVFRDWRGIEYRTGTGNFPLWESNLLRDAVFRTLFQDWENGPENFPDFGDPTSPDPNESAGPPVEPSYGAFPAYVRFAPTITAPTSGDLVIDGSDPILLSGDQVFENIIGNDDGSPDELVLEVDGSLTITGFVGGGGLTNLTLRATGGIFVAEGATLSSRQVAAGDDHYDGASVADSGSITLESALLEIAENANLLAHATGGAQGGTILLDSDATLDAVWSFLGIENFRNADTLSSIQIGMDARLRGHDVQLQTAATTRKTAELDQDFSLPTSAVLLANLDLDDEAELIVATLGKGILLYQYDRSQKRFDPLPTVLEAAELDTTSLALGDVDADGDLDLVAGNDGQADRFYRNDAGVFAAGVDIDVANPYDTRAVALGNLDADAELELIVGTDDQGVFLYEFALGAFSAGATIESALLDTRALALGDVDADGDVDLVVGNRGQEDRLYLNTAGVLGAGATLSADSHDTTSLALANLDLDPALELVVGTDGQGLSRFDFVGADPGVATTIDAAARAITSLTLGDVDEDGSLDLVVGVEDGRNRLHFNAGGVLDVGQDASLDNDPSFSVALGDLDGETGLDLVAGNDRRPNRVYLAQSAGANLGYRFGNDIAIDPQLKGEANASEPIAISEESVVLVVSEARSDLTLGYGALIEATNDVVLSATATVETDITTRRSAWGVTLGRTTPTATLQVEHGVEILAGNHVDIDAHVVNDLRVTTFVPSVGESKNYSVSLGISESNSLARLHAGTVIESTSLDVRARNDNAIRNSAIATGFGVEGDSAGLAATLAVGFYQSDATADVSGHITTAGDVAIHGESVNATNVTRSFASFDAGASQPGKEEGDSTAPDGSTFAAARNLIGNIPFAQEIGGLPELNFEVNESQTEDAFSVGLAIVTNDNVANALIGMDAWMTVQGSLTLDALAQDTFQISASGSTGSLAPAQELSVGGAIVYSKIVNRANAFVGWNATVDVRNTLDIDATAARLSPVDPLQLTLAIAGFGDAKQIEALGAIRGYGEQLTSDAPEDEAASIKQQLDEQVASNLSAVLEENEVGTSYVHGSGAAEAGGTAVGGGINILFGFNASHAAIAGGAHINQRAGDLWSDPAQTAAQDVSVQSTAQTEMVNYAGNPSVLALVQDDSDKSIGGFLELIFDQNAGVAYIDDRAVVSAGRDVEVLADTTNQVVTIAVAGGYAEKIGVDGAFVYQRLKNETWAFIENRATVTAGTDVNVVATSDFNAIAVAPALAISGEKGVGVGVTVNDVRDETRAFIADSFETVPPQGYGGSTGAVTAGNELTVVADSNTQAWAIAAAGAAGAEGENQDVDKGAGASGSYKVDGGQANGQEVGGSTGFGIAGAVAFNLLRQDTRAFVRDHVTLDAGNLITIEADSNAIAVAVAGGFAFGDEALAIGASYAHNKLDQRTRAFGHDVTLTSPSVSVDARKDDFVLGLSASVAGAKDDGAVAGGVTVSDLEGEVSAWLGARALVSTDSLRVRAQNTTRLVPISGLVATGDDFSFGANVGYSEVATQIDASIREDADVSATGDVLVSATNDTEAVSISASGSLSEEGAAAAGSGTWIDLDHTVDAHVSGTVSADGSLYVDADDETTLIAVAGGAAGGDEAGVGLSVAAVVIDRAVRAQIRPGARVDARGNGAGLLDPGGRGVGGRGLTLDASADDNLFLFGVGGAGAENVAVAGSAAGAQINGEVEAAILGDAQVNFDVAGATPEQSVRVLADHRIDALIVAGTIAGASDVGIGIAGTASRVDKSVLARIDAGAEVLAAGDVAVAASSNSEIDTIALGVSGALETGDGGGVSFAGAGSGAANQFTSVTEARIAGASSVDALGQIDVSAIDDGRISADAGGAALAIASGDGGGPAFAIGASIAYNDIASTARAAIDEAANVTAAGTITVSATTSPRVHALSIGGAVAGSTDEDGAIAFGLAGAVAVNRVANDAQALITGDSVVQSSAASVHVSARDDSEIDADAGSAAIALATGDGGGVAGALGASLAKNDVRNEVRAAIEGSATVTAAEDVRIDAVSSSDVDVLTVGLAGALAGGEDGGISFVGVGSGSENRVANSVEAALTGQANVTATRDLLIEATEETNITADAGGVALAIAGGDGGGVGVAIGVSAAINEVENTTRAAIDDATANTAGMSVRANSNATIESLSIAGSAGVAGGEEGGFAIAGAGALSDDTVTNTTEATITNAVVDASGDVTVAALDTSRIIADAGSGALAVAGGDGGGAAAAIGASLARNAIANVVEASIDDAARVTAVGSVAVLAESRADVDAFTLGVALALAGGEGGGISLVGAGSASANDVANVVEAHITSGAQVNAEASVRVEAKDQSSIIADAGAAAIGIAGGESGGLAGAVGASISANAISNTIIAAIDGLAVVEAGMDVDVDAISLASIEALTVAGSVAVGAGESGGVALGLAGSGSLNTIGNRVEAHVLGNAEVTAVTGALTISALDASQIRADAGAGALALGVGEGAGVAVAGSGAFAVNEIGTGPTPHVVRALLTQADVAAATELRVEATSRADIDSLAVGLSGALGAGDGGGIALAGSGSGAANTIATVVEAIVTNMAIDTDAALAIVALDESSVTADAGALALAIGASDGAGVGAAVGISAASNKITNQIQALVDAASLTGGGTLSLSATERATIEVLTVAGSAGVGVGTAGLAFAGAGAGSGNTIDNRVEALVRNASTLTTTGAVSLLASDESTIVAQSGAAALALAAGTVGGGLAGAGAIAINTIGATSHVIHAAVLDSTVTNAASLDIHADSKASIDVLTVAFSGAFGAGSVGVAIAGAGAVAFNSIGGTTTAEIARAEVSDVGAIIVEASDDSIIKADASGIGLSVAVGAVGVGLSMGFSYSENAIANQTTATISDSNVSALGNLSVLAHSQADIDALAIGASLNVSAGTVALGLVVVAGITHNDIANVVEASIDSNEGVGEGIVVAGDVLVSASDLSAITAETLAASINISAGAVSGTLSFGLSESENVVASTTHAVIVDSSVEAGGGVTVSADSTADIDALAVAASLGVSVGVVAVAIGAVGSITLNDIDSTIEAGILSSGAAAGETVTAAADILVAATDAAAISADTEAGQVIVTAGAVAVNLGFAISGSKNQVADTTRAFIEDETVTSTAGAITVSATSSATIEALGQAASLGVAGGAVGITGSLIGAFTLNEIGGLTEAVVRGSTLDAAADIRVAATDAAILLAETFGVAFTVGAGVVGGGISVAANLAENDIGTVTRALVDTANLEAQGAITVEAASMADIDLDATGVAVAIGAGVVGFGLAAAGALTTADIHGTQEALIRDSALIDGLGVRAAGSVTVSASDASQIDSAAHIGAISVSGGLVAVSFSLALASSENLISNTVRAGVDAAEVESTAAEVAVLADSTAQIRSEPEAASLAVAIGLISISGAGAAAQGINRTSSQIESFVTSASHVVGATGARIEAADHTYVFAKTSGMSFASGAGAVAGGAATTENEIANTITSFVHGSSVTATAGDVRIDAIANQSVRAESEAASAAIGVAVSGAQAKSRIDSLVEAHATDATLTATAGSVTIEADTNFNSESWADGLAAGVVGLSVMISESTLGGTTRAFADGALEVTASDLIIHAKSSNSAEAISESEGVGIVGGAGAANTARITRKTEAHLGSSADATQPSSSTIDVAGGRVLIDARTDSIATSAGTSGAVGLVAITVLLYDATIADTTLAYVGEGTTLTAAELQVIVDGSAQAEARLAPGSVGIIVAQGGEAHAAVDGTFEAFIGARADRAASGTAGPVIDVTGAVIVDADASMDALGSVDVTDVFGAVAINALDPHGETNAVVRAYLRENVDLASATLSVATGGDGGSVDLSATGMWFTCGYYCSYYDDYGYGAGVAPANGGQGAADAIVEFTETEIEGEVHAQIEAFIGAPQDQTPTTIPGRTIDVAGSAIVKADSDLTASAIMDGGEGGIGVDFAQLDLRSTTGGATRAYVGDGVDVTAGSIEVSANASADPDPGVDQVNSNLLSGVSARVTGSDSHAVEAYVGAQSGTLASGTGTRLQTTGTGDVAVSANHSSNVDTYANFQALALLGALAEARSDAISAPTIDVYVGDGAEIIAAGNAQFEATVIAEVDAWASTAQSSGIGYGGTKVSARLDPAISVFTEGDARIEANDVSFSSRLNRDITNEEDGRAWAEVLVETTTLFVGVAAATLDVSSAPVIETWVGSDSEIAASGAVTLTSSAHERVEVDGTAEGYGSTVYGAGVVHPSAVIGGTVTTHFDGTLSGAESLHVLSDVEAISLAEGRAGGGGALGGLTDSAVFATTAPSIDSFVSTSADVTANDDVTIESRALTSADAVTNALNFGFASSVGLVDVDATVSPDIDAGVRSGAAITSHFGDVALLSRNNVDTTTGELLLGLGATASTDAATLSAGLSYGHTTLDADAAATVDATVEPGAQISAQAGSMLVEARSSNYASAGLKSTSGGALNISSGDPHATARGTTGAHLRSDVGDGNDGPGAGAVIVRAEGLDIARAGAETTAGGIISIGSSGVSSSASPVVLAEVDGTIRAAGDLIVEAVSNTDGDAASEGKSGGIIDISSMESNVAVDPDVNARVASGSTLEAGAGLIVRAIHGGQIAAYSDGRFDAATAVTPETDTIQLDAPHGLVTGDKVSYEAGEGGTEIGGLGDGRAYRVIVESETDLQLGASFGSLDPRYFEPLRFNANQNTELISFTGGVQHSFSEGERVVYLADVTPVGGLIDGAIYTVHVVDERYIQLFDPSSNSPSPVDITTSVSGTHRLGRAQADVLNDEIPFPTAHGLEDGDSVTYRAEDGAAVGGLTDGETYVIRKVDERTIKLVDPGAPLVAPRNFSGSAVVENTLPIPGHGFSNGQAVVYQAPSQRSFDVSIVDDATDSLVLGEGHGFQGGDVIIYTAQDSVLGGLTHGSRYIVLYDLAQPDRIRLASIHAPGVALAITPSAEVEDLTDLHFLRRGDERAIGGLVDGATYYVANRTNDTFQLASDPGGSNIIALDTVDRVGRLVEIWQQDSAAIFYPNDSTFDFSASEVAVEGGAVIEFEAVADLRFESEYMTVDIEGVVVEEIFRLDGVRPGVSLATLELSASELAAITADGTISIVVTPSNAVNDIGYNDRLTLRLSYFETQQAPLAGTHQIGGRSFSPVSIPHRITLPGHGFSAGEPLTYRAPENAPFNAALVDGDANTIRLETGHGLTDGVEVVYQAQDEAIGGLTSGDRYRVIAVPGEPDRIQLATLAEPGVAIDLVPSTDPADRGDAHALHRDGWQPISGLEEGRTYYVASPTADSLQLSLDPAGSSVVDLLTSTQRQTQHDTLFYPNTLGFDFPADALAAGRGGVLTVRATTDLGVSNEWLILDGEGIVTRELFRGSGGYQLPSTTRIQLSAAELAALAADGTIHFDVSTTDFVESTVINQLTLELELPVDGAALSGPHQLGREGIDLTGVGSGRHSLVLDLTAVGSGIQRLEGVGGARAVVGAPSGDGIATASTGSSSGGLVSVSGSDSASSATPEVKTTIGSNVVLRGSDIQLDATSIAGSAGASANSGIGLVSIGDAQARPQLTNSSRVEIGDGSLLAASQNVEITSHASQTVNVLSDTEGDGLLSLTGGDSGATASFTSEVAIGDGVSIDAGAELRAESTSDSSAGAISRVEADGLGASAQADADVFIVGTTRTSVGDGSSLTGRGVHVNALVNSMRATAYAEAEADALGGLADARADVGVADATEVWIDPSASIRGETVELVSSHAGVELWTRADAECDCIGGKTDAEANTTYDSAADVLADAGATIAAADLLIEASQEVERYDRRARAHGAGIDFGGDSEGGFFGAGRNIQLDADVVLFSGPSPELEIDATGSVIRARGVTVNGGLGEGANVSGGSITVDPLLNTTAGVARIIANEVAPQDGEGAPEGVIDGAQSTFIVDPTWGAVSITNQSDEDLVLSDIGVANADAAPDVTLDADVVTLEFDIEQDATGATQIVILNEGAGDVGLTGVLDNPVGDTRIVNTGGGIVNGADLIPAAVGGGTIRSRTLETQALGGSIGVAGSPIDVELVRSLGLAPRLEVEAAQDVHLDLALRLREPSGDAVALDGGTIVAGGDVSLGLDAAARESGSSGETAAVRVDVVQESVVENVFAHFRPDVTPVPAHPLDARLFPDPAQTTSIASAFDFESLVAGGGVTILANAGEAVDPRIDLTAEIDTGESGRLDVMTNGDADLAEAAGALQLARVISTAGDIALRVADTGATGETLSLIPEAGIGIIRAAGSVLLVGGDGVTLPEGTSIESGGALVVRGDADVPGADPGEGASISILAALSVASLEIVGGSDLDELALAGTDASETLVIDAGSIDLGGLSVVHSGIESLTIAGRGGDDHIEVGRTNASSLFIDGGDGSDTVDVLYGYLGVTITVHDSGPLPASGDIDTLIVPGSATPGPGEQFTFGARTVDYDDTIEQIEFSLLALPADFNDDGIVDGADYTVWANHFGEFSAEGQPGDANGDGFVNGADYTVWADHYREVRGGGTGAAMLGEGGGGANAEALEPAENVVVETPTPAGLDSDLLARALGRAIANSLAQPNEFHARVVATIDGPDPDEDDEETLFDVEILTLEPV